MSNNTLCHGGIMPHTIGFKTLELLAAFLYLLLDTRMGVTSVGAILYDGVYSFPSLCSGNQSGIVYEFSPFVL